jgi:carbamoyl-phosphate synthase large subunit
LKVLVLGSGPIIIGQAAEFDYAGTQACRSLKEEGVETILLNSNPATIMTDMDIADVVYIEPMTVATIEKIINQENPDAILPTLGGQTGLNLAMELHKANIYNKYNLKLLGSPIDTIEKAEDREGFKKLMKSIQEPVPNSAVAETIQESKEIALSIGLPVVVRPAYTLGGTGGGMAETLEELEKIAESGIKSSPINQILIEKSLVGWKEIEFEVMRDSNDNCITVCNMENIDPMGVHTGDSIVVAPSQTLTDKEYQMLRSSSLKIIRHLGVEGGCNVQFAIKPNNPDEQSVEDDYYVIEVNPRVSRSSALASKATGYPIARVAAKIAIGKTLDEIDNAITKKTKAVFEPALDYCVVKIPRWPFDKFIYGDRNLGTQMKATGEVMAIDRTFESAFLKAIRGLEITGKSLFWQSEKWTVNNLNKKEFYSPTDERLWALLYAIRKGVDIDYINQITGVDFWFLNAFKSIVDTENSIRESEYNSETLLNYKRKGFSDKMIAELSSKTEEQVRQYRKDHEILPVYKMVDTCAAEFEAVTPYFYSTYETENEALPLNGSKAAVFGSGPIRIGQGIEFDYCSVHAAWALNDINYKSIMINSNPETVSTDFDTSDRLYFEPLDFESVANIIDNENIEEDTKTIVQFGGQTAINLSSQINDNNYSILGSPVYSITTASDRGLFENFLKTIDIPNPPGSTASNENEAKKIAKELGYPVLVRPSFVLGGRAMDIAYKENELDSLLKDAFEAGEGRPVLIDKYIVGTEIEVDAVCDGEEVFIPGIMEHIEKAGVHSGDSMAVYPPISIADKHIDQIVDYTTKIALNLGVKGLLNIQYVISQETQDVLVLEVNPRASRTIPFISKVTNVPMVKLAVKVMAGQTLKSLGYSNGLNSSKNLFAIKAPVFSMSKLTGVDTTLGPEMKSTGEVMGIDLEFNAAMYKALISSGMAIPETGTILVSIADRDKDDFKKIVSELNDKGFNLLATEGTANLIKDMGIEVNSIPKVFTGNHPNVVDVINHGLVDAVINTVTGESEMIKDGFDIRRAAAEKNIPCFTSLDGAYASIVSVNQKNFEYNVSPLSKYIEDSDGSN